MTNAFNWKQYTDEERTKRGETLNVNNTALKRSLASSKAVERIRESTPKYGTLPISGKTASMLAQKPKQLSIHGGKREGAGRPSRDLMTNRVYKLHDDGVSAREIARQFEVSHSVINRLIKKRNVKL